MKKKRNIWEWLAIVVAILCVVGATALTVAYGFTVGNAITFVIALVLIVLGLWMRKMPRWIQRIISIALKVGIVFFIVMLSIIVIHGSKDTVTFKEDCVLVLGCGIRGETVLPTLEARLDRCLDYLKHNPDALILVSGGQGAKEDIPEAVAMKRYLVAHGVSEQQIRIEDKSRNTVQNFSYSKAVLDGLFTQKEYTVAIITSDYHAYRVGLTADRQGMPIHIYNAGVKWYLRPSAYAREVLSICKFWLTSI
ncbi:YdcF family protein [Bacteroides sp. 51]|uniref:YdcF family protein n=1 Tax=Bacteroides sp. 51 TaxID=2302938 RepID=UPI0013D4070C|nr:YdcF family protein [Bacteroides sp. 51]NDV84413.1 YdcF family protein [Bacteroides sp. 51]